MTRPHETGPQRIAVGHSAPGGLEEQLNRERARASLFGHTTAPRVGRFRVTKLLGRGGMGEVFLARDEDLDRDIAVKLLRSDIGGGTNGRARLVHEAKTLARVVQRSAC